jgi:hypothetical protein
MMNALSVKLIDALNVGETVDDTGREQEFSRLEPLAIEQRYLETAVDGSGCHHRPFSHLNAV